MSAPDFKFWEPEKLDSFIQNMLDRKDELIKQLYIGDFSVNNIPKEPETYVPKLGDIVYYKPTTKVTSERAIRCIGHKAKIVYLGDPWYPSNYGSRQAPNKPAEKVQLQFIEDISGLECRPKMVVVVKNVKLVEAIKPAPKRPKELMDIDEFFDDLDGFITSKQAQGRAMRPKKAGRQAATGYDNPKNREDVPVFGTVMYNTYYMGERLENVEVPSNLRGADIKKFAFDSFNNLDLDIAEFFIVRVEAREDRERKKSVVWRF